MHSNDQLRQDINSPSHAMPRDMLPSCRDTSKLVSPPVEQDDTFQQSEIVKRVPFKNYQVMVTGNTPRSQLSHTMQQRKQATTPTAVQGQFFKTESEQKRQ